MRVLLNATEGELDRLGGDFTHYRDWRRMTGSALSFQLISAGGLRPWIGLLRKIAEKATRTWQPDWLRRRLFLSSRLLFVPSDAVRETDLIFSHLLFPSTMGKGAPVVWNSQGISPRLYYETYNRGQWTVEDVAYVYRELGQRADALVVFTHCCARNVVSWCPELADKTYVVPAAVFVDAEMPSAKPSLSDGALRVLFVGVDAERKGLPEVVEAYRMAHRGFKSVRLDIVSRPSLRLREDIATLKDAQLHLSSPELDVKKLMREADIFLLPTHADTYALAAIEAMAHGCAVVTSDLEPLPEVIPDGEVGFNVPAGCVFSLKERLLGLLENETLLRRLQQNARRRFESLHAPEVVRARLLEVFSKVLQTRSGNLSPVTAGMAHSPGKQKP